MSEKNFLRKGRIWTNGCYDILHVGHVKLFNFARSLGNKLIVGIDSDDRIRKAKGDERPVNSQVDRKEMLLSIRWVDEVVVFDSDEELRSLIKYNDIDTMVVGDDYTDKEVIGSENCKEVMYFKRIAGYSTTNILDRNNGS